MRPHSLGWLLGLAGLVTISGCSDRPDVAQLQGLGCVIPVRKGICVPRPVASARYDLKTDCELFIGGASATGMAYGPGSWEVRDPDGGALPSPCEDGEIPLSIAQQETTQAKFLVCSTGASDCPVGSAPRGTQIVCDAVDGGLSARLGAGLTAASLTGDGHRMAAVWVRAIDGGPDAGTELAAALLDDQLRPIRDGGAIDAGSSNICNKTHHGVEGVSVWAPPQLTETGAFVLAVGDCNSSLSKARRQLQTMRFAGGAPKAVPHCDDLADQISGVAMVKDGSDYWVGLSVDCGLGTTLPGAACPTTGSLAMPYSLLQDRCDRDDIPVVAAPQGQRVPFVGLGAVNSTGNDAEERSVPVAAVVVESDARPTEVLLRVFDDRDQAQGLIAPYYSVIGPAATAFNSGLDPRLYPPSMATWNGSAVVAWAGPLSGTFATLLYYDVTGQSPGLTRDDLALGGLGANPSPAPAAQLGPEAGNAVPAYSSVAFDKTDPKGTSFAMCYQALENNVIRTTGLSWVVNGSVVPSNAFNEAIAGDGPCAVSSALADGSTPGNYLFVYSSSGGMLRAQSGVIFHGDQNRAFIDGQPPVKPVVDLQLVDVVDHYALLVGHVDGTYTALRLDFQATPAASATTALKLAAGSYQGRPLLTADGANAWLTYVAAAQDPSLPSQIMRVPVETNGAAGTPVEVPSASQAATVTTPAGVVTAYAGEYRDDVDLAATSLPSLTSPSGSAWVRFPDDPAGVHIVLPRQPLLVGSPSLVLDETPTARAAPSRPGGTGQLLATFVPVGPGQLSFAAAMPAAADQGPALTTITERSDVHGLFATKVAGLDDQAFALYTTSDALPYLASWSLRAGGPSVLPPIAGAPLPAVPIVSGGRRVAPASSPLTCPAPAGGPELISLGPGALGASFCQGQNDGTLVRLLQPVDVLGQALGPAFPLGTQAAMLRCHPQTGVPDCPPASLVTHGPRLIRSFVQGGQTYVEEIACRERTLELDGGSP